MVGGCRLPEQIERREQLVVGAGESSGQHGRGAVPAVETCGGVECLDGTVEKIRSASSVNVYIYEAGRKIQVAEGHDFDASVAAALAGIFHAFAVYDNLSIGNYSVLEYQLSGKLFHVINRFHSKGIPRGRRFLHGSR